MARLVLANQATATRRRAYFDCRDVTDGLTPETGEAGGQPQISTNGGAFTNTGIGTLTHMGNGRYYADVTQTAVATAGDVIETRYKSANTAETPGDTFQVVAFDPDNAVRLGLTALPNAAADAAGGLPISDAGGLDLDSKLANTNEVTAARMGALTDWINGGRLDLILDAILEDTGTTLDALIQAIKAKTDNLPTDPADASVLAALIAAVQAVVDAVQAKTDNLPTDPADQSLIIAATNAIVALLGTPAGASIAADIIAAKAVADAIKAKSDNLPSDPADQSAVEAAITAATSPLATAAALAAVAADLPGRITKNTALAGFTFLMIDSADHVTGKTGLTVTATRSIDGAAFGACANAVSEVANGVYKIDLAAGDLNGNVITLKFTATGADARFITIVTQPT
jgi:hypothetical protein